MDAKRSPEKEFLNRYRYLVRRRESLMREIDMIRARATGASIRIKPVHVRSSGKVNDQMAEDAAMLADSTAALDRLVKEIDAALMEIIKAIETVDEERQKTLLTLRYIEGLSWKNVEVKMSYEHTQVMKIHRRALQKIREWMKERTKTHTVL